MPVNTRSAATTRKASPEPRPASGDRVGARSHKQDHRSQKAQEYRRWYSLKAWKEKRAAQLAEHPLCHLCEQRGIIRLANVADHVIPHRGDPDLFWNGELGSLCEPCHNASKQRQEAGGYDSSADLNGYPLDPNHPQNVRCNKVVP